MPQISKNKTSPIKKLARRYPMIALDTEATGLDLRHGARPFTCQMYTGKNTLYWVWEVDPLTRQVKADKGDLKEIQGYINQADLLILQNPKFDCTALSLLFRSHSMKLNWDWSKVRDTLLAGHLITSNQPHDLTTMALVHLGINIQPAEDALKEACMEARKLAKAKHPDWMLARKDLPCMPSAKESTWKYDMWLPAQLAKELGYDQDHKWYKVLADYALADPVVTYHLYNRQLEILREKGLEQIYLERLKVLPIVEEMETYGVTLSGKRLKDLQSQYVEESKQAGQRCVNIAASYGFDLELPKSGNNKSLRTFLLDSKGLNLKSPKSSKKTGDASVDKTVLEAWAKEAIPGSKTGVFLKSLSGKRSRDTACNYMEGYRRFWLPRGAEDWYVLHPSLNPTGTNTLRWSSSNPNEQNISKKEGFNLRYVFGPAPGREWWSMDYENIEMRIPAYESGEKLMVDLFEHPDDAPFFGSFHLLNFSLVYPDLFFPLCEEKGAIKEKYASTHYQWIKNFGFAKSYGAGPETADRAAHKVGAYAIVEKQLQKHAGLNQKMIDLATKQGYVETMPDKTVDPDHGYPIYCTNGRYGGYISPTIPLNYHVQSTAMWCTMKAMIRCHEKLSQWRQEGFDARLVMQVHDECVFDLPAGGKRNLPKVNTLKKLMEQSGEDISVPLKVSTSYHPNNWSESTKL